MSDPKLRIAEDVVFEVLDDETVVLNLTTGDYYTLNGTGTRAWQLIEELGDLDAVRATMTAEYAVADEQLGEDLDRLVRDLLERRLVTAG